MADNPDEWRAERGGEYSGGVAAASWLDDRGVSEVIGSILVFGLLVSLLAIIQMQAVPDANREVEFKHSKEVQRDLSQLSQAISRSAATGTSEVVTVATGTTYPTRLILYNPPAPTGTLRSSAKANVFILNVAGTSEATQDYVFGSLGGLTTNTTINTSRLAYHPDYNQYKNAPVTALAYGAVYDEIGDQTRVEARSSIVDGKQIDLRLLGDGVSSSGQLTTTLRTEPLSTGKGIPVRSLGDYTGATQNLTIQLPTWMSESAWSQQLLVNAIDDPGGTNGAAPEPGDTCRIQYVANGTVVTSSSFANATDSNNRYIRDCRYLITTSGPNYIEFEFEPGTEYQLRMSKIGFESGSPDDPEPKYITPVEQSVSLKPNGQTELSVTVRDRYNNPVSGVELIANISSGRTGATLVNSTTAAKNVTVTTNADGTATVTFATGTTFSTSAVTFKADFDGNGSISAPENTTVVVTPAGVDPIRLTDATLVGDRKVNLTVHNAGLGRQVVGVRTNYVTVQNQKLVAGSANLITVVGSTVVSSLTQTNVTNKIDGPDAVSGIGVNSSVKTLSQPAVENSDTSFFAASAFDPIPQNSTSNITLQLDEPVNQRAPFENGDALLVSVVVTFDDGHRETYTAHLYAPEDDSR